MLHWRVILLASLAVLLLLAGLVVLGLPDPYEGSTLYRFDETHTVRTLDVIGMVFLALGCVAAWGAGLVWQRRMYAS